MIEVLLWLIAIPVAATLLAFTVRRIILMIAALYIQGRSQAKEVDAFGPGRLPDVLILVACRDEVAMIPDLCRALSQLDYPRESLNIVLIDDASTDGTGRVMEEVAVWPGWNVLRFSANMGKARALNSALDRFPFGEIIYTFDADHRPDSQALRQAVRYFDAPGVAAMTGFTRVLNPLASLSAFYSTVESYTNQLVTIRGKDRLGLAPALLGSNCGYRRETLMAFGGFRDGALSEDSDLTVTFHKAGYKTRFAPDAISYQQVPQSLDGYLKQHIRWGRGLNDVAKSHRAEFMMDRRLSLALRLELLLFTAGYLDRVALMSAVFLMFIAYFVSSTLVLFLLGVTLLSLLAPLAQIAALFFKERMDMAMWVRLPLIPVFFLFDIFAALRATLETLLDQPRLWTKTQREELP